MIKRILITLVVLILTAAIVGGLVGFNLFRDKMIGQFFANRQRPVVAVSVTSVKPETWQPGIEAIGTIAARQGVEVAARASGVVKAISFASNDMVEKGELLVQLDDEVEQADLIAAKANVERDQGALDRSSQLSGRGFSSTQALDNAKAALDASRSQLERVQAQINQKKIVAPFSGTIGIPKVDVGQYLSAGTVIATLQDLKKMKVDFSVTEQRFDELKIGQTVRIGVAENDLAYSGKIIGINPRIDPQSRLVAVQAEFENTDEALRPGQFAFVRIELPEEDGVIALPQTAVVQSLYGTYVYVVRDAEATAQDGKATEAKPAAPATGEAKPADTPSDAKGEEAAPAAATPAPEDKGAAGKEAEKKLIAKQVFVTAGRRFDRRIEVVDGLKEGDRVVTAGQNRLSGGSPVTIDNTIDPAAATREEPGA